MLFQLKTLLKLVYSNHLIEPSFSDLIPCIRTVVDCYNDIQVTLFIYVLILLRIYSTRVEGLQDSVVLWPVKYMTRDITIIVLQTGNAYY